MEDGRWRLEAGVPFTRLLFYPYTRKITDYPVPLSEIRGRK